MSKVEDIRFGLDVIERQIDSFCGYLHSTSTEKIQIENRLKQASLLYAEFLKLQYKLEYETRAEDDFQARMRFEEKYYSVITLATTMLESETKPVVENKLHVDAINHVKLPRINLPEFDGSYEHWLEFHDTFHAIVHNNASISQTQKFYYLKSSLKGVAAEVIRAIDVSDANYQTAWQLLL